MTSKAQLKASKKYLANKKRINIVFTPSKIEEIENLIKYYGYFDSVPEFIRCATDYYIKHIKHDPFFDPITDADAGDGHQTRTKEVGQA